MTIQSPNETLLQAKNASAPDLTPAPLAGPSTKVSFAFQNVLPPSRIYITVDDQLLFFVFNTTPNQVLNFRARILGTDGGIKSFSQDFVLSSGGSNNIFTLAVLEGYLLSLDLTCSLLGNLTGFTYASVSLNRQGAQANQFYETVVQGYVFGNNGLSYPESPLEKMHQGRGLIRPLIGATPAAGAEINDAVPSGRLWRLISAVIPFVTSATAATRTPHLSLRVGSSEVYRRAASITQIASLTNTYVAGNVGAENTIDAALGQFLIPGENLLCNGFIRTLTTNIQAGDQWGPAVYLIEEWCYQL